MLKILSLFKITILGSVLSGIYLIFGLYNWITEFYATYLGKVSFVGTDFNTYLVTLPWSLLLDGPFGNPLGFLRHDHKYQLFIVYLIFLILNTAALYLIGWGITKFFQKIV